MRRTGFDVHTGRFGGEGMTTPSKVTFYTTGKAEVTVHFPEDKVCCQYCPLYLRYEENFKRYSCRLTGEWIIDPFHEIGTGCPLTFDEVKKE
jgi:hypothetical protein